MQIDLTPEAFKAWLESKPGRDTVGHRVRCAMCPVANFLKSQGPKRVLIGDDYAIIDGTQMILPAWVHRFNHVLDSPMDSEEEEDAGDTITAKEALLILDTCFVKS